MQRLIQHVKGWFTRQPSQQSWNARAQQENMDIRHSDEISHFAKKGNFFRGGKKKSK